MAATANIFYEVQPKGITRTGAHRVTDAAVIFFNALIGVDATTGLAEPYDGAAGTTFLGLATEERTGDTSLPAGDPAANIIVDESGPTIKATIAGISDQTENGAYVWATDDDTFTLTDPVGPEPIGFVKSFVSGSIGQLQLFSAQEWQAHRTH